MNWPKAHAPGGIRLSDQQRIDWLRLTRTESIGPLTFNALINRFGGASAALEALPELLKKRGKGAVRIVSPAEAERELEIAHKAGCRFLALGEPEYPPLLRRIDAAPPLIALKGRAEAFRHPYVAIVGSRNASGVGRAFTEKLAQGLVGHGFAIISGLARGIDTRAHEVSLGFATVAVLAGGLDRPYPAENVPLLERICENGAVITEMPFGWEPRGRDFPRRNRIISGVAYGTIVVEAARKSGSLISARFANEQGREVFAVPGSPLDPRAEGTNDLIRQGATLCASVEDVVRVLAPMVAAPDLFGEKYAGEDPAAPSYRNEPMWDELLLDDDEIPTASPGFAFEEAAEPAATLEPPPTAAGAGLTAREQVLGTLGPAPLEIDDIVRLSGVPLREVQAILLDLDLSGRIERHGLNRIALLP